jgi:Ca-activated chloride channel homolog
MRIGLVIFFLTLCFTNFAQSKLSKEVHDFGSLYAGTQRFVDITIENPGSAPIYILRIEQSPNIVHKLSGDVIPAGGKISLRVQVNPSTTGRFQLGCNVFMSDRNEPLSFTVKGNVLELAKKDFNTTACPDFNASPPQRESTVITIETFDKETREPLSKSKVVVIRNGEPAGAWITGRKGSFDVNMTSGYFYFLATHDGYLNKEAGIYVGPDIHTVSIPLTKDPELILADLPPVDTDTTEEAEILDIDEAKEILSEVMEETDTVATLNPNFLDADKENFDEQFFKPVNIEFVIDISSSMKQGDKMELMKYALNQLVNELRPVDRMGIVTYADNAQVFQSPTQCDRKEVILKAVSELRPEGMTAGGRGIKKGYSELMLNYDPDKTNIVIVITDGAFNKDSDNYQKIVKRYARKGVIFSVVGVKTSANDTRRMTEAATFGGGRFIAIEQLSDAQTKLFQEIRLASFRGR